MTRLSKGFVCSLTYSFLCCFCSSGRYSELHSQYSEAVNTVKEQKELITQLETDLLNVNALPSAFRGQGEVREVVKMLVMSISLPEFSLRKQYFNGQAEGQ